MSLAIPPKKIFRATLGAIVVAAAAMAVAPAQAGETRFVFSFGTEGSQFLVQQNAGYGWQRDREYRPRRCLTNAAVYRRVARLGYTGIGIVRQHADIIRARAERRGWAYALRIDRCSGRVVDARRLHRSFVRGSRPSRTFDQPYAIGVRSQR